MRVAVVGASGYAGGELLRLIAGHPDLDLVLATADSSAGKPVGEVHANLAGYPGLANLVFEPHGAAKAAAAELAFLALPAGQSAPMAVSIAGETAIVDLGPDFRLADPAAWSRHYGGDHAGTWVTGLPELPGIRPYIRNATQVAAPGCYATAAILALAPLASAGLIRCDDIVVVAASGTSGAGRSLRADLLGSEVMGSVSAYQAGGTHRHTPEIEQALAGLSSGSAAGRPAARVTFNPMLAPMPRGILATCTARLAAPDTDTAAIRTALAEAYADEPFVRLLPEGRWPATGAVAGSNGTHVQAAADPRTGRVTVVTAIDNLGKGAAGQAIQNANLMFGLPEAAGLTSIGVAP
ncbi:MAG TPA: N-acetyl-gamma-glutamyl-phosphate reductase [Streptosporangiaceae bacterium]|jgi:N-acetyl-gamma-glutamyl-phosphate reductase|nr:N-acetyl-gamma-glutamyl-phosphate reductase [Streptosporangiaceae bacterium]